MHYIQAKFERDKKGMNINLNSKDPIEINSVLDRLRTTLNVDMVLLTLSEEGICIKTKDIFLHNKVYPREIIDVSGAGDTVISIASLCITGKISHEQLAKFCNLAGGLVCEEVGVVPINKIRLIKEAKKVI